MAIEHRDIPEDGLHEPKGVSLSASNRVYVADGSGSGSWSQVNANTLQGTVNDSTPAGRRVVTDGSGGFSAEITPGHSFGTMNLTENLTSQAVTIAADPTLRTDSDYQEVTVAMQFDSLQNMTSGSNFLQVQESGLYLIDFWANVKSDTNATLFGLKFVVNGTDYVARSPKTHLNLTNTLYNLSANGIHTFSNGDQVKVHIAASKSVNITIEDMTFQMVYLGGL